MTIQEFADELAGVEFDCVRRRYDDLPKLLRNDDLPASWFEMPSAVIGREVEFATFAGNGVRYTGYLFIAVAALTEGFPANQRAAVLGAASEVEEWVRQRYYEAELTTATTLKVGNVEYRGVAARITTAGME